MTSWAVALAAGAGFLSVQWKAMERAGFDDLVRSCPAGACRSHGLQVGRLGGERRPIPGVLSLFTGLRGQALAWACATDEETGPLGLHWEG